MTAEQFIYWANVYHGLSLTCAILGGACMLLFIGAAMNSEPQLSFLGFIGAAMFFVVASFLPSEKTSYLMAAGKVSQDIITAPETKEVGVKILKILNQKLDEQVKEEKK
jgi:hypothetical protein